MITNAKAVDTIADLLNYTYTFNTKHFSATDCRVDNVQGNRMIENQKLSIHRNQGGFVFNTRISGLLSRYGNRMSYVKSPVSSRKGQ